MLLIAYYERFAGDIMKRIFTLIITICMLCSMASPALAAERSFTINGVTVTASSGKNVKNCATYAGQILSKIWNYKGITTDFNTSYNILREKSAEERSITEEHVKAYIQAAPLGSRIRITHFSSTTKDNRDNNCFGHTMVLVAKDNTAGTFTTLEGNITLENGKIGAAARDYTYEDFARKWTTISKKCTDKKHTHFGETKHGYSYFFYIADLTSFGATSPTTPQIYNITFDPNGGSVSQTSKQVSAGSVVGNMPTPTREGYTFLGWTYSQGGSAGLLLRTGDEMFVEKDITLYAAWKEIQAQSKTYEVILDNGSTCKTITVTNGGTYGSLPTPSRDGYTFDGWYTQASGGSKITASTKVNLTSSQTLYAHWIQNAVHKHEKINPTVSPEHPHYTFYTCSCGEVFTDNVENSVDSCLVCALGQLGDDMINSAIPEPPKGYWSTWSNWSTASASASDTRQVETRTITEQVKISDGYTEYRYGGYATSDGRHECWCETYLRNKFGSSNIRYTDWNTTRYKVNGTSWTCGNCSGNHVYVDHYGNDGRAWWPEYTLPNGKNYYWEESRTVDAQYETRKVTQYRYRDWVAS